MKNQKGITLITLVITIVVLVILTATISVNAPALLNEQKKRDLETDIQSLKEEVDQYYARYESLPIINKYNNVNMLNEVKNINDSEDYYVIDLSKIVVDLNYGKDYNKIKEKDVSEEITNMLDVYIINEQSHTIYYPKGIELEENIYYTTNEGYTKISDINIIETYRKNAIVLTENKEIKDVLGNKVVIPEGFKIAEDSALTVDKGIVIEDNDIVEGIGNNRGNQYVWVPVGEITKIDGTKTTITLGRYTFDIGTYDETTKEYNGTGKETLIQDAKKFSDDIEIQSYFIELVESREGVAVDTVDALNTTALDLKEFIDSVAKNGGYYIARYEASYGIDKKANSKVSNNYSEEVAPTKEGELWNFVTQIDAAKACRNIYEEKNINIETDLINSYAWDTAISYIQKCSESAKYSKLNIFRDNIRNTGTNDDEVCKINDIASNLAEWSTEYSSITGTYGAAPCVARGGNFQWTAFCSSHRSSGYSTSSYSSSLNTTFRFILYIK